MTGDKILSSYKKVKKTALDYVAPYNHTAVPLALEYAREAWRKDREYGLALLAFENGVEKQTIAKVLGVSSTIISRLFKKSQAVKKPGI